MDSLLVWSLLLFLLAVVLLVADVFIPSGGILTGGSFILVVIAIVLLWQVNALAALISAFAVAMIVPLTIWLLVKHFDHLPITRRLMLAMSQRTLVQGDSASRPDSLVGKRGRAISDLRPVGTCLIDGQRTECLAESGAILRDSEIEVVSDSGFEVKVREVG